MPEQAETERCDTLLPQTWLSSCEPDALAVRCLTSVAACGATLATAESLTGGLLAAELVSVPGASQSFLGGVVAYSPILKNTLLGVDAKTIASHTVVSSAVALAMARGVRTATGAQWGVSTTGEAGPDSATGQPPGTVWVACASPHREVATHVIARGNRQEVRRAAVELALTLLARELEEHLSPRP